MQEECQSKRTGADAKPDGSQHQRRNNHTFWGNWEAPFQGSLLLVAEDLSDGSSSPQQIRRGKSDGKNTSI